MENKIYKKNNFKNDKIKKFLLYFLLRNIK
jgi:hypothetical protein